MCWVDLDLENGICDRSGKFEKNNNPIAIPLSDDVLSILNYLRERQIQKAIACDPQRWENSRPNMFFRGAGQELRRRSRHSTALCVASTTAT
jgi:hypothetical protein